MEINIKIGQLAEYIEEYKQIKLCHEKELDISNLDCYINTPTGHTLIKYIIKKENLEGLQLTLLSGITIKCATKHILCNNGVDIYADKLKIGNTIDTLNGSDEIVDIKLISDTTFYDIGIDSPHLYYDSDGILHHNTIITAALSYIVEKNSTKRTIVIVPNKDLVRQTEKDYINVGLDVGVYYGDRKDIGKQHTICTWQSLEVLNKKGEIDGLNVMDAFLYDVGCVIVDECFDGNTLIQTPNGGKKISEINIGDIVINYDEDNKTFKEDEVIKVHENLMNSSMEDMYELEFDNGCIVQVTGNHKILTENRGWIRADKLEITDDIVNNIASQH